MNKGEENIRKQEYDEEYKTKDGKIERIGTYFPSYLLLASTLRSS